MTDTSVEALRFRATVRHDEAEVEDLPYLEEFWAVRASNYAALLAERDRYKARAEQAKGVLKRIAEMKAHYAGQTPNEHHMQKIATEILAQIDAEPAEKRGERE
jgi:hypothetical protein